MTKQIPSIGRIVHYVGYGTPNGEYQPDHRAAIVTEVPNDVQPDSAIGVCVVTPQGMFFNRVIPFDETGTAGGSWHWPEYVPAN